MIDTKIYQSIQKYKSIGYSKSAVSRYLNISRGTIIKFWDMEYSDFLEVFYRKNKISSIARFEKLIISWLREDKRLSAFKIRRRLYIIYGIKFTQRTMNRYLQKVKWCNPYLSS